MLVDNFTNPNLTAEQMVEKVHQHSNDCNTGSIFFHRPRFRLPFHPWTVASATLTIGTFGLNLAASSDKYFSGLFAISDGLF